MRIYAHLTDTILPPEEAGLPERCLQAGSSIRASWANHAMPEGMTASLKS
ncbi:hypothetical protein QE363_002118 [Sphingomonas sp. SORGH_AS870]|nr:hypothetical protein [Sphingomonas sp. SORGH_AS_0870]